MKNKYAHLPVLCTYKHTNTHYTSFHNDSFKCSTTRLWHLLIRLLCHQISFNVCRETDLVETISFLNQLAQEDNHDVWLGGGHGPCCWTCGKQEDCMLTQSRLLDLMKTNNLSTSERNDTVMSQSLAKERSNLYYQRFSDLVLECRECYPYDRASKVTWSWLCSRCHCCSVAKQTKCPNYLLSPVVPMRRLVRGCIWQEEVAFDIKPWSCVSNSKWELNAGKK